MSYLEASGPITKATFDENTAATHTAVAANIVATRKPRPNISCNLTAAGAVSVTIMAGATVIHGPVALAANGTLRLNHTPYGHGVDGAANTAVTVVLDDAVRVTGSLAVQHIEG